MKKIKASGWAEYITATFYICFLVMPVIVSGGFNITQTLSSEFKTFPANYLLYITPAVLHVFIKKSVIAENEKTMFLLFADILMLYLMYNEVAYNSSRCLFAIIAIIVLSLMCINVNELTAALTLLPGLLLTKLGIGYIFAAYIPVLLLMLLKNCRTTDNKNKNKASGFMVLAYLYIALLAVVLIFTKRITFYAIPVNHDFTRISFLLNFAAGVLLVTAACVMFIIRAVPLIKNAGIKERLILILFAVYPLIFAAAGFFIDLISNNFKSVFVTSLIIYAVGNIQLSLTHSDKVGAVIPEKIKTTDFVALSAAIFCAFCFS